MTTDLSFIPSVLHREILERLLSSSREDSEITGILLAGSFARGDAFLASDLDLYVFLDDGVHRPFTAETQNGILVECKYADFDKASSKLAKNPMEVYAYLDGRILYDRDGRLQELVALARDRFESYSVSEQERDGIAHWLRSALIKVRAARGGGDEVKAAFVVATTSYELLVGLWAVNGKPIPSSGGVLAHLKHLTMCPSHVPDWETRLFVGDTVARMDTFCAVAEWIVERLASTRANR